MTGLKPTDITRANIAYFIPATLNAEFSRLQLQLPLHSTPGDDARPFVCVDAKANESSWSPLTDEYRSERVDLTGRIEQAYGMLIAPIYLNDGAVVYRAPNHVFMHVSAVSERPIHGPRPFVRPDAMAEIDTAIRDRQPQTRVTR